MSLLIASTLLVGCESESPVDVTSDRSPTAPPVMSTTLASNVEFTATKVDALYVDSDGDGTANPGETIRYDVVVTNVDVFDAQDVVFQDILDNNTGLVSGSLQTTPIARDDYYCTPPGTRLDVAASDGVLVNDEDPDGSGLPRRPIVGIDESYLLGDVEVEDDGGFSYMPPEDPVFDGFRYYIDDGEGGQDLADVFILVFSGSCTAPPPDDDTQAPQYDESSILLHLGTLNGGQELTITFDVVLDSPFSLEWSEVCNQGLVSGSNFLSVATDDPDTDFDSDLAYPTCTPVVLDPEDVAASMVAIIGEQVGELEQKGSLNHGQAGSLQRQLDQTIRKLERGQTQDAIQVLQSFADHVSDLITEGTLSMEEGEPLIQAANQVIEDLRSP